MNPFISLIVSAIDLYKTVVFAQVILSLLLNFGIVNLHHPLVRKISYALDRLVEPVLRPIREALPNLGIDISPIILILLLQFVQHALTYYF